MFTILGEEGGPFRWTYSSSIYSRDACYSWFILGWPGLATGEGEYAQRPALTHNNQTS